MHPFIRRLIGALAIPVIGFVVLMLAWIVLNPRI